MPALTVSAPESTVLHIVDSDDVEMVDDNIPNKKTKTAMKAVKRKAVASKEVALDNSDYEPDAHNSDVEMDNDIPNKKAKTQNTRTCKEAAPVDSEGEPTVGKKAVRGRTKGKKNGEGASKKGKAKAVDAPTQDEIHALQDINTNHDSFMRNSALIQMLKNEQTQALLETQCLKTAESVEATKRAEAAEATKRTEIAEAEATKRAKIEADKYMTELNVKKCVAEADMHKYRSIHETKVLENEQQLKAAAQVPQHRPPAAYQFPPSVYQPDTSMFQAAMAAMAAQHLAATVAPAPAPAPANLDHGSSVFQATMAAMAAQQLAATAAHAPAAPQATMVAFSAQQLPTTSNASPDLA